MDRPDLRFQTALIAAPLGSLSYGRGGLGNNRENVGSEKDMSRTSLVDDTNTNSPTRTRKVTQFLSSIKDVVPTGDPKTIAKRKMKKQGNKEAGPASPSDSSLNSMSAGTSKGSNSRKSRDSRGSLDNTNAAAINSAGGASFTAFTNRKRQQPENARRNAGPSDRSLPPIPSESSHEGETEEEQEQERNVDGRRTEEYEEDIDEDQENEVDGFNVVHSNVPEYLNEPGFISWSTGDDEYQRNQRRRKRRSAPDLSRNMNTLTSNISNHLLHPHYSSYPAHDAEMSDHSRPLSRVSRYAEPSRSPPPQFRSPVPLPQPGTYPTITPGHRNRTYSHFQPQLQSNAQVHFDPLNRSATTAVARPTIDLQSTPTLATNMTTPFGPNIDHGRDQNHDSFHLGGPANRHEWQQSQQNLERNNSNYSTVLPRYENSISQTMSAFGVSTSDTSANAHLNPGSSHISTTTDTRATITINGTGTITEGVEAATSTTNTTAGIHPPTTALSLSGTVEEPAASTISLHTPPASPMKPSQSSRLPPLNHQNASTLVDPGASSDPSDPLKQPILSLTTVLDSLNASMPDLSSQTGTSNTSPAAASRIVNKSDTNEMLQGASGIITGLRTPTEMTVAIQALTLKLLRDLSDKESKPEKSSEMATVAEPLNSSTSTCPPPDVRYSQAPDLNTFCNKNGLDDLKDKLEELGFRVGDTSPMLESLTDGEWKGAGFNPLQKRRVIEAVKHYWEPL